VFEMPNIRELLLQTRSIAVVDLSRNPARPSHEVASYLLTHRYRVVPVNPNYDQILDQRCYPSLSDIPATLQIDMVNIFRRPEAVPGVVEEAIRIGAKTIWMQVGVIHPQAAEEARQAGLTVVMDRCLMVEHQYYVC